MIPRSVLCVVLIAGLEASAAGAADGVLPRPSVDFALEGRTAAENASVRIAHSNGRIRLDVSVAGMPGSMTSLVDTRRHRIVVLSALPGMQNMAVEMELPEDYAFVDLPQSGAQIGSDTVAGEDCTVWRAKGRGRIETIDACITTDGIVLRAEAKVDNQQRVVFEATNVARGPQDPALFEVPRGLKITKIPRAMQDFMPGLLPGLLPGTGR